MKGFCFIISLKCNIKKLAMALCLCFMWTAPDLDVCVKHNEKCYMAMTPHSDQFFLSCEVCIITGHTEFSHSKTSNTFITVFIS
jgi:hypothetical protein